MSNFRKTTNSVTTTTGSFSMRPVNTTTLCTRRTSLRANFSKKISQKVKLQKIDQILLNRCTKLSNRLENFRQRVVWTLMNDGTSVTTALLKQGLLLHLFYSRKKATSTSTRAQSKTHRQWQTRFPSWETTETPTIFSSSRENLISIQSLA